MELSQILMDWYRNNQRDLPWRRTNDPYAIWLSEVILQQTRVEQGMPYWLRFMENFPTVTDLANADEREVLRLWQGLGYYSRARNLHAAAKVVRDEYNGNFPNQYEQIRALKGIGDYTAAAISSFAFNLPHAVVDGNVYRFLSRIFAINTPIDSNNGKKEFFVLANELLDKSNPGTFNQSLMEFGAMQCKPSNPDCSVCPFMEYCKSYASNSVSEYPVKSKKTKTRNRYFNYLILSDEKNTIIQKREAKDIWQGLYQFPLIESENKNQSAFDLSNTNIANHIKGTSYSVVKSSSVVKHVLSHQIIYAKFWWIKLENIPSMDATEYINIPWSRLSDFGMPQLIVKYLENEES
ncbi:MAG: A/G-specific adenine glycosylase [Bacteroidota bacterium]|jgi:A/G-specific adenine glycosylase